MDRYEASVLNRITDKHGPGWTLATLAVMRGRSIAGFVGVSAGSAGVGILCKAMGWL